MRNDMRYLSVNKKRIGMALAASMLLGLPTFGQQPLRSDTCYTYPCHQCGHHWGRDGRRWSKDVLIIYYEPSKGSKALLKAAKKYKAEIIYQYNVVNAVALRIPKSKTLEESIAYFKKVKGVTQVSRDQIYHLDGCGAETF